MLGTLGLMLHHRRMLHWRPMLHSGPVVHHGLMLQHELIPAGSVPHHPLSRGGTQPPTPTVPRPGDATAAPMSLHGPVAGP